MKVFLQTYGWPYGEDTTDDFECVKGSKCFGIKKSLEWFKRKF